jgi:hypothetical protein
MEAVAHTAAFTVPNISSIPKLFRLLLVRVPTVCTHACNHSSSLLYQHRLLSTIRNSTERREGEAGSAVYEEVDMVTMRLVAMLVL